MPKYQNNPIGQSRLIDKNRPIGKIDQKAINQNKPIDQNKPKGQKGLEAKISP